MAVWIWKAPFAPLFWCDIPMEIDHTGNVLPASADLLFACGVLFDSNHKPIIESLQILAALHWYSFLMICLLAVLLHLQIKSQQADFAWYMSSDLSLTWYLFKVSMMLAPAATMHLCHIS